MVWYAAVVIGILATIYAYRKKLSIRQFGITEVGDLDRLLGSDFGVSFCASITLAIVLVFILTTNPSNLDVKNKYTAEEVAAHRALGEEMGKQLAVKLATLAKRKDGKDKTPGRALIIDREYGNGATVYHEALLEGLRAGFDSRVEIGAVELLKSEQRFSEHIKTEAMWLRNVVLDEFVKGHADCDVVVSFIPVEDKFSESMLAKNVQRGVTLFGLYTGNPYRLTYAIVNNQVTICMVPSPVRNYTPVAVEQQNQPQNRDLFEQNFIMINEVNAQSVAKRYRRLLHLPRRLE